MQTRGRHPPSIASVNGHALGLHARRLCRGVVGPDRRAGAERAVRRQQRRRPGPSGRAAHGARQRRRFLGPHRRCRRRARGGRRTLGARVHHPQARRRGVPRVPRRAGDRRRRALAHVLDAATAPRNRRRLLAEAFVVGIANAKAIIFLAATRPQLSIRAGLRRGCRCSCLASSSSSGGCDSVSAFGGGTCGSAGGVAEAAGADGWSGAEW